MLRRAIIALGMLLAWGTGTYGLDPALDVSQYAHTAWTVRGGFSKGWITSIAQTSDGYLWLGTEFGLLRFDGARNVPLEAPAAELLPSINIRSLLAARDGALWIGTAQGLASWKDGKLTQYPELAGQFVNSILQDREGIVWVSGYVIPTGRLCAIQSGSTKCYGEDGSLGGSVASLHEDSAGNLWVAAGTGLWRWKPGPPKLYPMPEPVGGSQTLIEDNNGVLMIAMRGGIRQLAEGKAEPYPLPATGPRFRPFRVLQDRSGGLWIGTDRGLVHVHHGRTDVFAQADGLSGDLITALFEDREGNIWVATSDGLDRFRDFGVPTISVKQGLSDALVWSVLAAGDGSVWLGSQDGLNRWKDGQITIYLKRKAHAANGDVKREAELSELAAASEPRALGAVREIIDSGLPDDVLGSLFQDDRGRIWVSTARGVAYFENSRFVPVNGVSGGAVHSIVGDSAGNIWISSQNEGLLHLLRGSVVEQIPWARLGRKDFAYAALLEPLQGGLWLGFYQGGVVYFKDGQVRASYAAADGMGKGSVTSLQLDRDRALWAATEGGLSRVKDGRVVNLTSKNGLPCDAVHSVVEDDAHSFWLDMACGLVRIARPELDKWVADPKRTIQITVFDSSDGVRSHANASGFSPRQAKTADGRLWFLSFDGVSVIDPRHLPFNKIPPPVHIEQITADRKTYWQNSYGDAASSPPRLPPLVRDLTIDYTALSLVVPEKVRFRVKLEGWDRDWQDVGTRRQAFYTNLPPKNYRFRVTACNNSGVWNEEGAFLDFSVAPAYYQTWWFRVSGVAAFVLLLWGLYQMRLRQVAREYNMHLEGRVSERTRIARELHDTLLQSFQGVLLSFQAGINLLPHRAEEAKKRLEGVIEDAEHAVTEGRDAVQGLRWSTIESNNLAHTLITLAEQLASSCRDGKSPLFNVEVEGETEDLQPILRDEVYRITGEAMRNAFRHAEAKRLEVEIHYDQDQLRVRVRDDGKGIDEKVVKEKGRAGHYGLHGMYERAKLVGGKLEVWSKAEAGTEVELTVPAAIAYESAKSRRWAWFLGKEREDSKEKRTEL